MAVEEETGLIVSPAWQQADDGILPQPYLDSLDVDRRTANWKYTLERDGGSTVLLDYADDGQLAGFASFGRSRDDDAQSTWGELEAIYYLKQYWGLGHG